jgi:Tfp pilus assembly protein PilN
MGLHRNDEIIAVNGIAAEKTKVNDWIAYFENDVLLTVKKDNHIVEKILKKGEFKFYTSGRIERVKNPTAQQEEAFKEWLG